MARCWKGERLDFLRHSSGVRWRVREQEGAHAHQRGARGPSAIGTPSTGLSLVGLRPRRARLRFTRRREGNDQPQKKQEQRPSTGEERLFHLMNP